MKRKKIISTIFIICSLVCICLYTRTIGIYFIPENKELKMDIMNEGVHLEKVQVHLSGNQCIHVIYSYPDTDKNTEEKETVMETKSADMYMEEAQAYIENEDYLSAIEVLAKGAEETGDAALAEKEKDLREHVVVKNQKQKVYEEGRLSREVEYDEAGNEVKYISYREDGSIYRWYEYLYDEAGYETKFVYYNGDGSIYIWSEYEYDKKGNQTKVISYNEDDSIYAWSEYEYDEKGNQIKSTNYNGDGSIYDWSEYEYDEIGNITKEMRYDENGLIKSQHEYEWDKDGNCTKYTAMGACSDDIYRCKCTYDEKGNITKVEYYNGDSIYEWCEYEYDTAGNETKRIVYNEGGRIINRYEYEYNEDGQEIKYIYYNDDGNLNGWDESEYDALGNIIKKTGYVGARYSSIAVLGELLIFKTARVSAVTEYEYEYVYVDSGIKRTEEVYP